MMPVKSRLPVLGVLCVYILFMISTVKAQDSLYQQLWSEPAITKRIDNGIEDNRKADVKIVFAKANDKKRAKRTIIIEQISHQFLFGTTLFMADGFDTQEKNEKYTKVLTELFNHGTVPFYWEALEPTEGNLRYSKNSAPIYRRPPPDAALEFATKHNIYPKGHTLVWDSRKYSVPKWLPGDTSLVEEFINKRIADIASRYGDKIHIWDVVNEVNNRDTSVHFPYNFVLKAFKQAEKVFPAYTTLMINETTSLWYDKKREYNNYYQLIENLLSKGAKIDAIGLQCHFFHGQEEYKNVVAGKTMQPLQVFDILDTYSHFNKPLHITEVTIPTIPDSQEGQEIQAKITRNLYRLWFSHPSVQSIVWWNMIDNTAAPSEDQWRGGFLDRDLNPKKSYYILQQLLNNEWKTKLSWQPAANEHTYSFRGFYGKYRVTIVEGNNQKKYFFTLEKGRENLWIAE